MCLENIGILEFVGWKNSEPHVWNEVEKANRIDFAHNSWHVVMAWDQQGCSSGGKRPRFYSLF